MEFPDYANMVAQSVQQNNEWSAQQAANQMAFQERMSNTAHQREIADLKAAGLNPVLSAKLGGASTPSGASASGDTSGTSALVDLIGMAMETANAAAGAAEAAAESVKGSSGRVSISSPVQDNSGSLLTRLFDKDPEVNESAVREIASDLYVKNPKNLKQIGQNIVSKVLDWTADIGKKSRESGYVPPAGTSAYYAYLRATGQETSQPFGKRKTSKHSTTSNTSDSF